MIKLVDVVYHHHGEFSRPDEVIRKHWTSTAFALFLKNKWQCVFVKHMNGTGVSHYNGLNFYFFKRRNNFWQIPFAAHRFIKNQKPDIILVEGSIFPLQLIFLHFLLPKVKIIVQHHGEKPLTGFRIFFQRWANRFISAYLFTAIENANAFLQKKVIDTAAKIAEVPEASSFFSRQDKALSIEKTGMQGSIKFLWVGRLNENKDPLTVLQAFRKFVTIHPDAALYMIFTEDTLLAQINQYLNQHPVLQRLVHLTGSVLHDELPFWYSAADYFVAASKSEGSGYALIEAMACGCIPLVSAIPSFTKLTGNGECGLLFPVGNAVKLHEKMNEALSLDQYNFRLRMQEHFEKNLSFGAIAAKIYDACCTVLNKPGYNPAIRPHTSRMEATVTGE